MNLLLWNFKWLYKLKVVLVNSYTVLSAVLPVTIQTTGGHYNR